jgi:hypothetical protein
MEAAKRFFKTRKNGAELGLGELWASGAFAGTVNTVVANPVEHIRIRTSSFPFPHSSSYKSEDEMKLMTRTPNTTNP